MNPETQLSQLKFIVNQYSDLVSVKGLLHWDLETIMPAGGSAGRGHQLATVTRIAHETFTSDEVGQLLEQLLPYAEQINSDSDDARFILVTDRLFKKRSLVPASLMAEVAKAASDAHPVWVKARESADFASFLFEFSRPLTTPFCEKYDITQLLNIFGAQPILIKIHILRNLCNR